MVFLSVHVKIGFYRLLLDITFDNRCHEIWLA